MLAATLVSSNILFYTIKKIYYNFMLEDGVNQKKEITFINWLLIIIKCIIIIKKPI